MRVCKCVARGLTVCLVCFGVVLAPVGAKNPPSAVVGHVLTMASSTGSISSVQLGYSALNTVTGAVHRLPIDLPRLAAYEPDKEAGYRLPAIPSYTIHQRQRDTG
jgi:hypothetical protein